MSKIKQFLPAIIWGLLIMALDFIPANPVPTKEDAGFFFIPFDKLVHVIQHLMLVILLFHGFALAGLTTTKNILSVLLVSLALGLFIEIIQELFIPHRTFNKYDVLANVIGSLGILLLQRPLNYIVKNKMEIYLLKNFYKPVLWMLVILVLCMMPSKDVERIRFWWMPHGIDKITHCCLYIGLAVLSLAALFRYLNSNTQSLIITISGCILYGVIIEVLQHFYTSTRHFELADILINSTGAILGSAIFFLRKSLFVKYF